MIPLSLLCLLVLGSCALNQTVNLSTRKYKYIEGGVSKEEAKFIVEKHNILRKLVANGELKGHPRGIDIGELQWDEELARAAQNIADTCTFEHVKVNDTRWRVGQNLYTLKSTAYINVSNWNRALDSWFKEHRYYVYNKPDIPHVIGHYTQMVWSTTGFIGCGYSFFETDNFLKYQQLYVCNYGPGGNIEGVAPYKTERDYLKK